MRIILEKITSFIRFDKPFLNSGNKLKKVSVIGFWVLTILLIIGSVQVFSVGGYDLASTIMAVILSILLIYVISLIIYGLGELIENSKED